MTPYTTQRPHRSRAMLLQDQRKRRNQAREAEVRAKARAAERSLAIAQRDLESARARIRDALPVYVRAQELERYMGRTYAYTVAFNPECVWRASFENNLRHRERDVYELDSHVRYMAQDAAEKIRHTIMEEIRKQTGIPGGRYGR